MGELTAIKDAETIEVLANETLDRMTRALNTLKKLKKNGVKLADGTLIHVKR